MKPERRLNPRAEAIALDSTSANVAFPTSTTTNFRVDDLAALVTQLKSAGIEIIKGPESHENGKFAWLLDPEGNKVELWEPKLWDEKNKQA